MLHKLFENDPWFAPKRYGYGAGLPIAWQGWALLAAYLAIIVGIALPGTGGTLGARTASFVGVLLVTGVFMVIAARHTHGGWKWRWGGD
ncbi:hypothetical protein [Novosphingobium sp. fls2-241-R2A-195]|jgi:hypothetical protein|uniref:hypothetical protein n=1 Tax=Novosphingobium sp. fls2-241-R2A-195 TaxID=3040296 RepID=UPI00254BF1ED|nr:hypothetical protein [Novosphingobium sp. fls2-241-R2A-195]